MLQPLTRKTWDWGVADDIFFEKRWVTYPSPSNRLPSFKMIEVKAEKARQILRLISNLLSCHVHVHAWGVDNFVHASSMDALPGNTSWNWLFNKSRLHLWMVLFLLCDVDPIMINWWSYFLSWPLRDFFDVALDKNHNILETQLGVLAGDLNSTGTAELNRSKHGAYRINQNQIQF